MQRARSQVLARRSPPEVLPGDVLAMAKNADRDFVLKQLKERPQIAKLQNQSETLLMAAASNGDIELVSKLLDAGAELLRSNNRGRTALTLAFSFIIRR